MCAAATLSNLSLRGLATFGWSSWSSAVNCSLARHSGCADRLRLTQAVAASLPPRSAGSRAWIGPLRSPSPKCAHPVCAESRSVCGLPLQPSHRDLGRPMARRCAKSEVRFLPKATGAPIRSEMTRMARQTGSSAGVLVAYVIFDF